LSREYLREFSKKFEMAVMLYSDAWGKLIHEKTRSRKSRDTVPLSGPQGNLKQLFFYSNSKSKIVASVGGAYVSKDKMVCIWATFKKN